MESSAGVWRPVLSDGRKPVEITGSAIKVGKLFFGCSPLPQPIVGIMPSYRPGTACKVSNPSPVLEGHSTWFQARGNRGDFVFLASSLARAPAQYIPIAGLYVAPLGSTTFAPLGTIDATGVLAKTLVAPTFPGPGTATSIFVQALFMAPSGEYQLSRPTEIHVLDPAF